MSILLPRALEKIAIIGGLTGVLLSVGARELYRPSSLLQHTSLEAFAAYQRGETSESYRDLTPGASLEEVAATLASLEEAKKKSELALLGLLASFSLVVFGVKSLYTKVANHHFLIEMYGLHGVTHDENVPPGRKKITLVK